MLIEIRPGAASALAGLKFDQPMHYLVPEDAIAAVEAAQERRKRLEAQVEAALPVWSLAPVVGALQALRGVARVGRPHWRRGLVTPPASTIHVI